MILSIIRWPQLRNPLNILGGFFFLGLMVWASRGEGAVGVRGGHDCWVGAAEDIESETRFSVIQATPSSEGGLFERHLADASIDRAAYSLSLKALESVGFKGVLRRSFVGQAALMKNEEAVRTLLSMLKAEDKANIPWTKTLGLFVKKVIYKLGREETLFDHLEKEALQDLKTQLAAPGTFSLGHILAYFGMDAAFQDWINKGGAAPCETAESKRGPSIAWMVYWGDGGTEEKRYNILKMVKGSLERRGVSRKEQTSLLTGAFIEERREGRRTELLSAYEGVRHHGRPRLCVFLETEGLLERAERGSEALAAASAGASSSSSSTSAAGGPSSLEGIPLSDSLEIRDERGRTPLHWLFEGGGAEDQLALLQVFFNAVGKAALQEAFRVQDSEGGTPWHQALRYGPPVFLKNLWGLQEGLSSKTIEDWGRNAIEDEEARKITGAFLSFTLPRRRAYGIGSIAGLGAASSAGVASTLGPSSGAGGLPAAASVSSAVSVLPRSFPPAGGGSAGSNAVAPLLHEAFLYQSLAKFIEFEGAFMGFLGLVDTEGETLFQKGSRAYIHAFTEADQKTLYEKFKFGLQKIGTEKVDPIIGQGMVLHMQFAKDRPSVWKILEMEGYSRDHASDELRKYVKELEGAYQSKLKERERREGRETINSSPALKAFDESFYRISQQLFAAQQVLATGMVTREETGAEAAVGYIEVIGEMIPLPGAAVIGRVLTAMGKGYLGAREEGRIENIATRHARSSFEDLSQAMTMRLKDPLEDLTEESAETLGEVLGSWFLMREPEATEFGFIEGFVVDVLKDGGISTFLDSRSRLSLKRKNRESLTVKAWLHRLGIRDALTKEWHRKGHSPLAYIEGTEEHATELGFVDRGGHPAQKKIGTSDSAVARSSGAAAAGVTAGVRAAAEEDEGKKIVLAGGEEAKKAAHEAVRSGGEAAKGCGCSVQ